MLVGRVNEEEEPEVPLILDLGKKRLRAKGIVDTGFNGYISVPKRILQQSDWTFLGCEQYEIATGQVIRESVFFGKIHFCGELQEVFCVASDSRDVLLGTRLLKGKKLVIDFRTRRVTIEDASHSPHP